MAYTWPINGYVDRLVFGLLQIYPDAMIGFRPRYSGKIGRASCSHQGSEWKLQSTPRDFPKS